ncbi:response regulator [Ancylobacter oerskovii]|nr:response regulator [Ancylobacter oerskovii]
MGNDNRLAGRGVFVVEDEPLVALMIEAMIEELGAVVIGSARRLPDALDFVAARHQEIDVALLDLNLGGIASYDVAQAASDQGIPVVFSTGYDDEAISEPWRSLPLLSKPFQLAQLEDALASAVVTRRARGRAQG